MNVLMTYRLQAFESEILPQFEKFKNDNITFIVQSKYSKNWLPILIKRFNIELKINIITIEEILKGKIDNMQFDYEVGNPPYHQITGETTKPIWDKLIVKFYDLLKPNGEMSMIHPGGWRFATNKSKEAIQNVRKIYNENNVDIELHDKIDGSNTFGASIDFDIIHLKKESRNRKTKIRTNSEQLELDISKYGVLPTNRYDLFFKLIAKDGEETVKLLNDYSYGSDNRFTHISKEKNNNFIYPIIYTITNKLGPVFYYSNTNKKGHFGIPKLILKKGSLVSVLDIKGDYGMTQFAAGIIDEPENHIKIQKALYNPIFRSLKNSFLGIGSDAKEAITDGLGHMNKFIQTFRKDFWKEFYTEEMEQELIDEGKLDKEGNLILF